MKKIHILSILGIALTFGACDYNDKNFDGLDEMVKPTHVVKEKYTLTDADYVAIGDNSTNKALAKEAKTEKALENVKTNLYLSEEVPGSTYLPAFLSGKYFTADAGSSIKVSYNYKEAMSSLLAEYASVKYLKLTEDDYKFIYGNTAFAPYLNAKTEGQMYKILNENFKDAAKGTVVFVEYKLGEGQLEEPRMWQSFDTLAIGELNRLDDWFISSVGGNQWQVTSFNENQYVQYTANKAEGECIGWMITPAIQVTGNESFGFDVTVGYYNADCLSVLISKDFTGNVDAATWTDITAEFTIPKAPTSGYGTLASAGRISLAEYAGENIRIAFKYVGDGAHKKTTTYQIDNIMVGTSLPENSGSSPVYAVKIYDGKSWKDKNSKVYVLAYEDYIEMGQSKLYFTADVPAAGYLPAYLSKQIAYPVDGEACVVIYRYFNGKELKIYSDEYVYSGETVRWALDTRVVEKTEQYVLMEGKWNFDPSTVITLEAVKGNEESAAFYQAIVDYVGTNYGTDYYQTRFTNAEFYYGASSYQNNFSFRLASWRTDHKAGETAYKNLTDEELTELMYERLPEAIRVGLVALYGDADAVPGVQVTYTVNFSIYDGKDTKVYTIQFLVTGKAVFEYVEDSLQEVVQ